MYNQFVRHPAGRKRRGLEPPLRLLTNHQVKVDSMDSSIIAEVSASFALVTKHLGHSVVYGVGRNYHLTPVKVNGKLTPAYNRWCNILRRCYCPASHVKNPSYIGCSMDEAWHDFSDFERWFSEHHIEGFHIDKDILTPGNKVYGPENCIFVPQALNSLLTAHGAARGLYPLGVSPADKSFKAMISENHVMRYLGVFPTSLLAHQAWQTAKACAISNFIVNFRITDPRIRKALDLRVVQLRDDLLHNRITEKL